MHAIRSPRRRQQAPPVRLAVEFALSGRVRSLSSPVGIDAVMRMHQLLARPALLYLLAHPMMYTRPLAISRRPYRVTRLERIAPRTWTLARRRDGHVGCAFRAGQFAWLKTGSAWRLRDHPFSIASAPAQLPEIQCLIKEAGGVGFAPVLSLLRELVERGERRPVILIVGNRIAEQIVFEDELLPREAPERWLYFVCGPTPMIDAVEETLERLDIPLEQIVSERFRYDSGRPGRRERRMLALFGVVAAANLLLAVAFALRG